MQWRTIDINAREDDTEIWSLVATKSLAPSLVLSQRAIEEGVWAGPMLPTRPFQGLHLSELQHSTVVPPFHLDALPLRNALSRETGEGLAQLVYRD